MVLRDRSGDAWKSLASWREAKFCLNIYMFALSFIGIWRTIVIIRRYGIALVAQAIPPIPTHLFVAWSDVCLSSVCCHIRGSCLNRSTDLDAFWQVGLHLWSPMTHCVRWGSLTPQGKGRFEVESPQPKHAIGNCCFHLANRKKAILHIAKLLWCLLLQRTAYTDWHSTSVHLFCSWVSVSPKRSWIPGVRSQWSWAPSDCQRRSWMTWGVRDSWLDCRAGKSSPAPPISCTDNANNYINAFVYICC